RCPRIRIASFTARRWTWRRRRTPRPTGVSPGASAPTVAGIEIRSLRKHFGDLHAVDGVDLSIRDGEFLVLLGSSGSGKTTLLRMIAGLERPTSGEIRIGGERVDGDVPPRARGIALVRDPKVFLLDEPLANQDAKLRNTARDDLKRFQRRIQTTTVYVTHDQVEAMGLGDRIVVMERGKVRQIGTPQEVYEDPVDTFVATFVGQPPMNLLDAGDPSLPPRSLTGFRPEHFLPKSVFGSGEDLRTFRFAVRRVEYLGSHRYVYGSIAGSGAPDASVIAKLPATIALGIPEGETNEFAVPQRALRYFDAATGLRRKE